MKTKVLVFSSSGIEYVTHTPQIGVIPDKIKSQYGEEYDDSTELDTIQFYERAKNDKYFNPTVEICNSDEIGKIIEASLANNYDRFIIFVNDNDFAHYGEPVEEILNKYPHLDITTIKINVLAYPLAHLAIDSEKIVRTSGSLDQVISYVNSFRNTYKIYFYSPKENMLPSIKRIDFDDDVISSSTSGKLYLYDGELTELSKNVRESYLEKLLDLYVADVVSNKVVPFMLYTNKYSSYNDVIERKLLSIFSRLKTIKKVPIPSLLGSKIGYDAVGVGFIKKIDE